MGRYLNPGNEGFKRALRSEIYVDKTYMIDYLNSVLDTDNAFVCVSRPRRFGKSMAANMIAAYYDKKADSGELFERFRISESQDYRKHLNQHNVIFLNIQQIFSAAKDAGFTEDEVRNLCKKYERDFWEIRRWYDGYVFLDDMHIYNPKSVVDAMRSQRLRSFWTSTETYEALQIYIDLNQDGLKEAILQMLAGECCRIDIGSFQNDMMSFKSKDDVLTLLVHLGYLAYDEKNSSVFIPNEEVRGEFIRAVKNGGRPELYQLLQESDELIAATLRMDGEAVAKKLEAIHSRFTAPIFYHNEQALRMVLMLAYIGKVDDYHICQELPTGTGYADIVLQPKNKEYSPIVVELKWDKNAQGAIEQIKKKNYVQEIESKTGEILLVGISYDKEKKSHECVIEKLSR